MENERALVKAWVEAWRKAGTELESMRRRRLETLTDEDVRAHVADLFGGQWTFDGPPREISGLVEQQRWFARLHRPR